MAQIFVPHKQPTYYNAAKLREQIIAFDPPWSFDITPSQNPCGFLVKWQRRHFWQSRSVSAESRCERAVRAALDILSWKIAEETEDNFPPLDMACFAGLVDREPHIRLIYDFIHGGSHTLLHGPPAGGKTRVAKGFVALLGTHCWHIDFAAVTKAGLENEILQRAESRKLPRVVVAEELDKARPYSILQSLLQVMEGGRIEKTSGRGGTRSAAADVTLLATANSVAALARNNVGAAILSRFGVPIPFDLPDTERLREILRLYAKERRLDPKLVEVTLELLAEHWPGSKDARLAKALLACGHRLLDGTAIRDIQMIFGGAK